MGVRPKECNEDSGREEQTHPTNIPVRVKLNLLPARGSRPIFSCAYRGDINHRDTEGTEDYRGFRVQALACASRRRSQAKACTLNFTPSPPCPLCLCG